MSASSVKDSYIVSLSDIQLDSVDIFDIEFKLLTEV